MPLYDYLCANCGFSQVLNMKMNQKPPHCPKCGHFDFAKQISPFRTAGLTMKSGGPKKASAKASSDVPSSYETEGQATRESSHDHHHSHSDSHCSHGHHHSHSDSDHSSACSSKSIDKLIARHDKQHKPVTIKGG